MRGGGPRCVVRFWRSSGGILSVVEFEKHLIGHGRPIVFALNPVIKLASDCINALVDARARSHVGQHTLQQGAYLGMRVHRHRRLRSPALLAAERQPVLDSGKTGRLNLVDELGAARDDGRGRLGIGLFSSQPFS